MKFYEALKLANDDGKKIRLVSWNPNEFICWSTVWSGFWCKNGAEYTVPSKLFSEDWEVYEQLTLFGELKPGDRFKLPGEENWQVYHKIHEDNDNNVVYFSNISYEDVKIAFFKNEAKVVAL